MVKKLHTHSMQISPCIVPEMNTTGFENKNNGHLVFVYFLQFYDMFLVNCLTIIQISI